MIIDNNDNSDNLALKELQSQAMHTNVGINLSQKFPLEQKLLPLC